MTTLQSTPACWSLQPVVRCLPSAFDRIKCAHRFIQITYTVLCSMNHSRSSGQATLLTTCTGLRAHTLHCATLSNPACQPFAFCIIAAYSRRNSSCTQHSAWQSTELLQQPWVTMAVVHEQKPATAPQKTEAVVSKAEHTRFQGPRIIKIIICMQMWALTVWPTDVESLQERADRAASASAPAWPRSMLSSPLSSTVTPSALHACSAAASHVNSMWSTHPITTVLM